MVFFILAAVYLLLPIIRFLMKRCILLVKIKSICRKRGFSCYIVNPLCIFSGMKKPNCDMYIHTADKVFSVKLCGVILRNTHIRFADASSYAVKRMIFNLVSTYQSEKFVLKSKPPYNFRYKIKESAYDKPLIPILLMCPVSSSVTVVESGCRKFVGNGDAVPEGYFYNRTGFLNMLKSEKCGEK